MLNIITWQFHTHSKHTCLKWNAISTTSVHSLPYSMFGVQFSSVAQSCPTLCNPIDCSTPGFPITNFWSLLKLKSIKSVMPSNHLILCHPLLLLLSILPSIRVFSNESVLCIRWPKYCSFTFSISTSVNIQD